MTGLCFVVDGEPQGKARPRVVRGHAYTPEKTAAYESRICAAYRQAEPGRQMYAMGVPLSLWITAYYQIPQSTTKTKRALMKAGQLRPTKKPDTDNIGKVVADALNGIAYYDDAQIVTMCVRKMYGTVPRLEIEIDEAEPRR